MPLLSGLDLAIQMQAVHPHCKVLLFSGEWDAADLSETARKRSCEFEMIPKPVHPKALLRKVQEMLAIGPALPSNGEDRARKRLAENMKETRRSGSSQHRNEHGAQALDSEPIRK
jgi:DNA-binding NtrC family response regulator